MNQKPAPLPEVDSQLSGDERLVKNVVQKHMDNEVDNLDFNVTSRLAAARYRALEQNKSRRTVNVANKWVNWRTMAGSTAVLALATVIGSQIYSLDSATNDYSPVAVTSPAEISPMAQTILVEDLSLLSSTDDLDFYQAIEFLEWMEGNSG